ncbi:hypothetical protein GEOBRER4_n0837 [Citrifermentans bremense]|uniref:TonB C-terminal domain-containing protein n=1 Tax=Citrifermentans bremense TaxID=60035 RepID=A0A6S6M1Z8_9BACT|nr:energy transducer TonB [Citrifermentans bremense]BCG46056.1 hypothetical protein GEOBRER4_n0837 [Citrifermentans bremense]
MARLRPALVFSLLLHLALAGLVAGLLRRQPPRGQAPADPVVAYLDLRGDKQVESGAAPSRPAAPIAAAQPARHPLLLPAAENKGTAPRPAAATVPVPPAAVSPPPSVAAHTGRAAAETRQTSSGGEGAAGARANADNRGALLPQAGMERQSRGQAVAGSEPGGERRGAYLALVKKLIEARKEYPLAARKSGIEGSCQRRFRLGRDGALKRVETSSSCGHPFLDAAATRAITAVGSFPPPPEGIGGDEPFSVTITFTLARGDTKSFR